MPIRIRRRTFDLTLAGAAVPSILLLPDAERAHGAALLLHGYGSTKERLSDSIGRALAGKGIASLAIDLPLHGDRDDQMIEEARSNPLGLVAHWNTALKEAADAITWLKSQSDFDAPHVCLCGYSLGSYIALQTAAADTRADSVIVAAGGDLPQTPWTSMVRMMADPLRSAAKLDGRPLLLLHGKTDRTITPVQAQRLFDAAKQPKEIRWYDSGHVLPTAAAADAATWLKAQI